ncbi:MAG: paraquat-inducible protein A [Methyloligellaceae bacterium]
MSALWDKRQISLVAMIIVATGCLVLGLTLPVIRLSKYYFDQANHSILSAVNALFNREEYFLGGVVFVFAILMPVIKLLYLLILASLSKEQIVKQSRTFKALDWVGKWSMHDVLILAFTILYVKSSSFSQAVNLYGVYFFGFSLVLTMIAYQDVKRIHSEAFEELDRKKRYREALSSPSNLSSNRRYFITLVTFGAVIFLVLGVTQPVMELTHLSVWTNQHSILSVAEALYSNQQYFLATIILLFSVVFPGVKIFYLLTVVLLPPLIPQKRIRFFKYMNWLGRWSMMDVMILALMVFYINGSAISKAATLSGIYFFAVSVLLTMVAYGGVKASGPVESYPN